MTLSYPRDTSQWIISGTDSFRLGSRKVLSNKRDTEYNNWGGNRANINKKMRIIWEADKGYKLCNVDQGGAEALIVAHLCKAGKYRSLFQHGIKPHTYLALKLFPDVWRKLFNPAYVDECLSLTIPELAKFAPWKELSELIKSSDDWEPSRRYYHLAKKTIHAASYGMREHTFRTQLIKETEGAIVLTFHQAAAFLLTFHKEFPEIKDWHWRVFSQAKVKHELRNLFNFPYEITNFVDEDNYRDLIAWVPQSTVACITRQAFINLQEYIEANNKDWHLLNDCHDSYLAESPIEENLELASKMKEFIEIELVSPLDQTKFRMKSGISVGFNWAPRFEKKDATGNLIVINPEGLVEIKL